MGSYSTCCLVHRLRNSLLHALDCSSLTADCIFTCNVHVSSKDGIWKQSGFTVCLCHSVGIGEEWPSPAVLAQKLPLASLLHISKTLEFPPVGCTAHPSFTAPWNTHYVNTLSRPGHSHTLGSGQVQMLTGCVTTSTDLALAPAASKK